MSGKLGRLPDMPIDDINPPHREDEKLRALVSGLLNIIEDFRRLLAKPFNWTYSNGSFGSGGECQCQLHLYNND
jgi:hypothetical protein